MLFTPSKAPKTRQEAAKRANSYMRWSNKAKEEWDMKACVFWENRALELASSHSLTLTSFTLAGHPVATVYR